MLIQPLPPSHVLLPGILALLLDWGAGRVAATAKPNFVILFVDDMGLDQIEVAKEQAPYGMTGNNGTIKTPNVKRLAAEGLVFQNWYSAYHICSPSRAAMMVREPRL